MNTCKWPGCNAEVHERSLCGHHQMAMKVAFGLVTAVTESLGLDREVAVAWTCKFGPHIVARKSPSGPFELIRELENQKAVKMLIALGYKQRAAYDKASFLRGVSKKVPTGDLVRMVLVEELWVSVEKMSREVGTTHRYLRHLIYEDQVPKLVELSVERPSRPGHRGFLAPHTEKVRSAVTRVDKSRKRE